MAFTKYGQAMQEMKAANDAKFMSNYQDKLLMAAQNPGTFSWDGKSASYTQGAQLGSLSEAWNQFKRAAESRGVSASYASFAQQYNQVKQIQEGQFANELQKLVSRGVTDKKIKNLVKEDSSLKNRLLNLGHSTGNQDYITFAKRFLPYEGPSMLERMGELPTGTKLAIGGAGVGAASMLGAVADPEGLSKAEVALTEAKQKFDRVHKNDGSPRKNIKSQTIKARTDALQKAARTVEDAGGSRASRYLKKVKGFTPKTGMGRLGAMMIAPGAAGLAEKALTGEDTGIAAGGVQAGLSATLGAGAFRDFIRTNKGPQKLLSKTMGKEFMEAAAKKAAGEKISEAMEKKMAKKLGKWAAKFAARQGVAATGGAWTGGLMNLGMAAWSAYDLFDIGKSLLTGDWE